MKILNSLRLVYRKNSLQNYYTEVVNMDLISKIFMKNAMEKNQHLLLYKVKSMV